VHSCRGNPSPQAQQAAARSSAPLRTAGSGAAGRPKQTRRRPAARGTRAETARMSQAYVQGESAVRAVALSNVCPCVCNAVFAVPLTVLGPPPRVAQLFVLQSQLQ
jgi:hypothetical protein